MDNLAILLISVWLFMSGWFLLSIIKKRNDVADVAWGVGFVLVAWISLFIYGAYGIANVIVALLVTLWGARLALHIALRHRGKLEDYRYSKWREQWRFFYTRSYFQVFMLQGALLLLVSAPVWVLNMESVSLSPLILLGLFVWGVGFFFEVVGDLQLRRFLAQPQNKGKLMQSGLWKYSRHPNYFGEITCWWGLWLVVLFSVPISWGLFALIGPLTITILILKVSGVPLLEEKMKSHPDFAEYKRKTSILIPLPPRR